LVRGQAIAVLLMAAAAGCSGAPSDAGADVDVDVEQSEVQSALRSAAWEPLGGNLNPFPGQFVSAPSLVVNPPARPALAFSTVDPVTGLDRAFVLRWRHGDWTAVGEGGFDGQGPSIAADDDGRLYACFAAAGKGPVVQRWDGDAWVARGGDIGIETGFAGTRYLVESCDGIQLARGHRPVVAWSADVGAKNDAVYVAQWQRPDRAWAGIGPGRIGGRAGSPSLATDGRDQLYVATFSPGGSFGGGDTTRVWSWDGAVWVQLGPDMPATGHPVIAAGRCSLHLALEDDASGAVTVMKWLDGAWSLLPSPGLGSAPALAFTSSGHPVVAFIDTGEPRTIRVVTLVRGAWRDVGGGVASLGTDTTVSLTIAVDARDRPTLAWSEEGFTGIGNVFAMRYGAALR
jgi:hypothetical protein